MVMFEVDVLLVGSIPGCQDLLPMLRIWWSASTHCDYESENVMKDLLDCR